MASKINLSRKTRVFLTTVPLTSSTVTLTAADTWELQVQDGYSFSQSSDATVIQLSEAGPTPVRGQRSFNDKRNPAEWSFSTYIRPYIEDNGVGGASAEDIAKAPESKLWAALLSTSLTAGTSNTTTYTIKTDDSNVHQLASFGLIFLVDNVAYGIENCAVNQAEVSFDLQGIAMVAWSGMGNVIREMASAVVTALAVTNEGTNYTGYPLRVTDADYAKSFITNKLTALSLKGYAEGADFGDTTLPDVVTYNVPITGGNLTISNNIEYITPDTLGVVDTPIGYFTGSRSITGSLTAYLRTGEVSGTDIGALISNAYAQSTNAEPKYAITVQVGGSVVGTTHVDFKMPYVTMQFPTVDVQDVVSATLNFTAQGASGNEFDVTASNELEIIYNPTARIVP